MRYKNYNNLQNFLKYCDLNRMCYISRFETRCHVNTNFKLFKGGVFCFYLAQRFITLIWGDTPSPSSASQVSMVCGEANKLPGRSSSVIFQKREFIRGR